MLHRKSKSSNLNAGSKPRPFRGPNIKGIDDGNAEFERSSRVTEFESVHDVARMHGMGASAVA